METLNIQPLTTTQGTDMAKFNVHSLDLWGNADDGYEVNNAFITGKHILMPVDVSYDELAEILIAADLLADDATGDDIVVEGDPDYMLCIYASKDHCPLWNLDRVDD